MIDTEVLKSVMSATNKATTTSVSPPKAKHVRQLIIKSHESEGIVAVIMHELSQKLTPDKSPVPPLKALITIHNLFINGSPACLKPQYCHPNWMTQIAADYSSRDDKGFGPVIREYAAFLRKKLVLHDQYPDLKGNFSVDRFMDGTARIDVAVGLVTVQEVLEFMELGITFAERIVRGVDPNHVNECKLAPLIPFIADEWNAYNYTKSLLQYLYKKEDTPQVDTVASRFITTHFRLRGFYTECSFIRFITSLTFVPSLPEEPPQLKPIYPFKAKPAKPTTPHTTPPTTPTPIPTPAPAPPPPMPQVVPAPVPIQSVMRSNTSPSLVTAPVNKPAPPTNQWVTFSSQESLFSTPEKKPDSVAETNEFFANLFSRKRTPSNPPLPTTPVTPQPAPPKPEPAQPVKVIQKVITNTIVDTKEITRLQGIIAELETKIRNLEAEITQLKETINKQQTKIKETTDSLEKEKQLYSQLQLENGQNKELIKSQEVRIQQMASELEIAHNSDMKIQLEISNLKDALNTEQSKGKELLEQLEYERKRSQLLQTVVDEKTPLESTLRDMEKLLLSERHNVATLTAQLAEASNKVSQLQRQCEQAEQSNLATNTKLEALTTQHAQLAAQLRALQQSSHDQLQEQKRNSDRQFAEVVSRAEKAESRCVTLETASRESNTHAESLTTQNLSLVAQNNDLQAQLADLQAQLAALKEAQAKERWNKTIAFVNQALLDVEKGLSALNDPSNNGNSDASQTELTNDITKLLQHVTAFGKNLGNPETAELQNAAVGVSRENYNLMLDSKGYSRGLKEVTHQTNVIQAASGIGEAVRAFVSVGLMQGGVEEAEVAASLISTRCNKFTQAVSVAEQARVVQTDNTNIDDLAERELLAAAHTIEALAKQLAEAMSRKPKAKPGQIDVNDTILEAAIAISQATSLLVAAAAEAQRDRVARGKAMSHITPYVVNATWAEGLISAGKAVAEATNVLVSAANNAASGNTDMAQEGLLAASKRVAASTAQLVAATRSKATLLSPSQERVENAAKGVSQATALLVAAANAIASAREKEEEEVGPMKPHQFKIKEMEQQMLIIKLEKELHSAQRKLLSMRKAMYPGQDNRS
ncbi:cytoskeleton assembly control protein [Pelomyxa schiedti]|nr:cytoskeleton assembly control protein [Pelomyxa schiedti]